MFNNNDINKIKNIESKSNFEYVLQSFYSKNYKATVLLLYNLLINDLYSKLLLMDENGYFNCKNELEYIENVLKDGDESKYSIVEEKIFETYKLKKILNHSTIDLLLYFKKIRNKCAHPFFFKENDYTPTYEEVYLFIKKIYDDILIVDAFFKDPYEAMASYIESYKFPELEMVLIGISNAKEDSKKVANYFEKKFFRYMTDNNYVKLFKSLVDLSIAKNTDEILLKQYSHYLLLISLMEYLGKVGKISLLNGQYDWSKLKEENIYNDSDKKIDEQQCFSMSYLFRLLSLNKAFVEELKDKNEDIFELIKNNLYKNVSLFSEFWNLFDYDINVAIDKISDNVGYSNCYRLISTFKTILSQEKLIDLVCKLLSKVPTFDGYSRAEEALELLIKLLNEANPKYNQESIDKFLEIINDNRQFYDKSRNNRNEQIKSIIDLGYSIDAYDNLKLEEVI